MNNEKPFNLPSWYRYLRFVQLGHLLHIAGTVALVLLFRSSQIGRFACIVGIVVPAIPVCLFVAVVDHSDFSGPKLADYLAFISETDPAFWERATSGDDGFVWPNFRFSWGWKLGIDRSGNEEVNRAIDIWASNYMMILRSGIVIAAGTYFLFGR